MQFRAPNVSPSLAILTSLPEFVPISKSESEIIDTAKRQIISYFLPPLVRMREWRLLYSIRTDGESLQTFYSKLKKRNNTLILIKDEDNYIFGAYCCEPWHISNYFYGKGESFTFSFKDEDDIKVYNWSGQDLFFQYSDDESIMIGGGTSAIYIQNQFKTA